MNESSNSSQKEQSSDNSLTKVATKNVIIIT